MSTAASPASPAPEEILVRHNSAEHRFETTVGSFLAVAEYELADGTVVFTHTFVPAELRGRGIAEKLVRAALAWAEGEGRQIVPACSYVATFVERNPAFRALVRP